jgi:GST-like protein
MIELFFDNTPNGKKISIMLEEINFKYKITRINIRKKEQFSETYKKINPYGKIPAIIDHDKNLTIIESGAILIYLAKKSKKFLPINNETKVYEWLMFQISNVGPTLGNLHHYSHFNPGKSLYSEERFYHNTLRVYDALNQQLKQNNYLAGAEYSIADISLFPWIARHDWHMPDRIDLRNDYKFLVEWYDKISLRSGVIRGFDCLKNGEQIPKINFKESYIKN